MGPNPMTSVLVRRTTEAQTMSRFARASRNEEKGMEQIL